MNKSYSFSTEKSLLDVEVIHQFLTNSYWAKNIPKTTVQTAIDHSLCFGVYEKNNAQIGFARVITDRATFAYLSDVFILPAHRKKGLSKLLLNEVQKHPDLQNIRRFMLATSDAHKLYKQYEFSLLNQPEIFMEIWQPNIYQNG